MIACTVFFSFPLSGHFLLTNLLLEKLKSSGKTSDPSRIINIITLTRDDQQLRFKDLNWEEQYDWKGAFLQSKLALKIFTVDLAKRLDGMYHQWQSLATTESREESAILNCWAIKQTVIEKKNT